MLLDQVIVSSATLLLSVLLVVVIFILIVAVASSVRPFRISCKLLLLWSLRDDDWLSVFVSLLDELLLRFSVLLGGPKAGEHVALLQIEIGLRRKFPF